MSRQNHLMHSIRQVNGTDSELLHAKTLIEICDQDRVLIEHHLGIIHYGCTNISLKVSFGSVSVCGEKLQLRMMSKDKMVITGIISAVTLRRGM